MGLEETIENPHNNAWDSCIYKLLNWYTQKMVEPSIHSKAIQSHWNKTWRLEILINLQPIIKVYSTSNYIWSQKIGFPINSNRIYQPLFISYLYTQKMLHEFHIYGLVLYLCKPNYIIIKVFAISQFISCRVHAMWALIVCICDSSFSSKWIFMSAFAIFGIQIQLYWHLYDFTCGCASMRHSLILFDK